MRPYRFAFVTVMAVLFSGVTPNRPNNETTLLVKLNGEPRRWQMPDGGQSGMFGSGTQCMPVNAADAGCGVFKLTSNAKIHLCVGPADGGCSTTVTDPNYGDPVFADTPYWFVTQDFPQTTQICMVPATGSANVPVFCMR